MSLDLVRLLLRLPLAAVMIGMGVMHFVATGLFVQMVPPALPSPVALVWISGVAEILLGVGLLIARSRRLAGYGLVLLLLAVFPANIYMAVSNLQIHGLPSWLPQPSSGALWIRLPFQFVVMGWALIAAEIWPRGASAGASFPSRS